MEFLPTDVEANVLSEYDKSFINDEMEIFESMSTVKEDIRTLKEFSYFINMHNTQKQLTTFQTPGGQQASLPMDWGPSISYFFGNRNGLRRAMYPKPEVYEKVESFTGQPYDELMADVGQYGGRWTEGESEPLIYENRELLSVDRSRVLSILGKRRRDQFVPVYEWAHQMAVQNNFISHHEAQNVIRLLNIELILDKVWARTS
ncbi:hypothetical protein VB779_16640 [Haloarculaceae archaeon H-GB11]|nr:hypothetical protein [Haloarculaceae archaeon H-GB11]